MQTMTINTCDFRLVRHLPVESPTWFKATDQLRGDEVYGDPTDQTSEWSIQFSKMYFNQFAFATADLSQFIIASNDEILNQGFYDGTKLNFLSSSDQQSPYESPAKQYYRLNYNRHPTISLSHYPTDVLYRGEARTDVQ